MKTPASWQKGLDGRRLPRQRRWPTRCGSCPACHRRDLVVDRHPPRLAWAVRRRVQRQRTRWNHSGQLRHQRVAPRRSPYRSARWQLPQQRPPPQRLRRRLLRRLRRCPSWFHQRLHRLNRHPSRQHSPANRRLSSRTSLRDRPKPVRFLREKPANSTNPPKAGGGESRSPTLPPHCGWPGQPTLCSDRVSLAACRLLRQRHGLLGDRTVARSAVEGG